MLRKTKIFCDNIIFKNHFADKISKVLRNQNLQFMYDFDFNTYLEVYLSSLNLEKHSCKIPKTPALGTLIFKTIEWHSQRLMNIYNHVLLIYINVVDMYRCNQRLAFAMEKLKVRRILIH